MLLYTVCYVANVANMLLVCLVYHLGLTLNLALNLNIISFFSVEGSHQAVSKALNKHVWRYKRTTLVQ